MKIFVVGSGTWGLALSCILCDNGHEVLVYARDLKQVEEINTLHTNKKYFEETLPSNLVAVNDFEAIKDSDLLLLAVPSNAVESMCMAVKAFITKPMIVINTAKGFDPNTNERMSDVIRRNLDESKCKSVVSLIGPSHAEEVVKRMLTTVCAVSLCENDAKLVQELFSNETFRVYRGNDEIGSELGVAIKNTIALASGMLTGLGYGDNTRAALMTRGLAEMIRFGVFFGGRKETFMGLTGMGDLIVTCTSVHSRNYQAGLMIGQADSAKPFWENNTKTVEGVRTTKVLYELKNKYHISMPIVDEIYQVLYENKKPSQSGRNLMLRELKAE